MFNDNSFNLRYTFHFLDVSTTQLNDGTRQITQEMSTLATTHPQTTTPENKSTNKKAPLRPCTHAERVSHLQFMCAPMHGSWQQPRQKDEHDLILVPPETRPSFYENRNCKVFFCKISKVASTTWSSLVSKRSIYRKKVNFTEVYDNFTKFFVVRHPFDRVLSAYYNIVDGHFGYGPEPLKKEHIAKSQNVSHYKNLTLGNFVDYLTTTHGVEPANILYDRHWNTYSHLCDVCNVPYDNIIRYENLASDSVNILKHLGIKENYFATIRKKNSRRKSGQTLNFGELFLSEFKLLSSIQIDRLWQRYSSDMKLLGYHFDKTSSVASCRITLQNGDECC